MRKLFLLLIIFGINLYSYSGDTTTTSSGLKYIVLKKGGGKKAKQGYAAEVHYTGWLVSGKKFDSSRDRNETFEFTLGAKQVIKGWDEGVALMRIGDKFRLIIPPDLAYGENGAGEIIPPNATLIFDIELISVHKPKKPVIDTLMALYLDKDIKTVIEAYYNLKDEYEDKYNFKESQLNILGYRIMELGKTKDAIKIFKLNVEEFPDSYNVYDSLGEGYFMDGNMKLAEKYYKKSLELNPDNDNAKKMLERIKQ